MNADELSSLGRPARSLAERVDRACDRFEADWRAGRPARIEDHLAKEASTGRHTLLRELLAAELELRRARGETPRAADYAARFPGDGVVIDEAFTEPLHPSGDGHEIAPVRPSATTLVDPLRERLDPLTTRRLPVVPGYEVLGELGRGGMGVVYWARQVRLNRPCALKMILAGAHAGPEALQRFLAEAETVARLEHPNVVRIYHIGESEGLPYVDLEYLAGGSLSEAIASTPRPARDAAMLLEPLARGIAEAHRLGIVHRDLKPANILLAADGTPKVTDFGLAKAVGIDAGLTRTQSIVGSPSYMAPEQAEGKVQVIGPAADVYALGAILYELLTGRPPFKAATAIETLEQVKAAEPVRPGRLLPGLSRDIETICLKCLEKAPGRRYASASDLADELVRFLRHAPIRARPIGPIGRFARLCRRNPAFTAASALAALALVAVVVVSLVYGSLEARAAGNLRAALEQARQLSARSTFERALGLCEQGDANRGVLWLARSLELAAQTDSADLRYAIRANLTGWIGQLHRLRHGLEHGTAIQAIAFSPDGRTIATGSDDATVRLWDTSTGGAFARPLPHSGAVISVAFSCDGQRLLTVAAGGTVSLWDWASGRMIGKRLSHPAQDCVASLSPDGSVVVTAGGDGTVRFWSAGAGTELGSVLHHEGPVRVAVFSADGRSVLTASDDATAALWDVAARRRVHSLPHPSPVRVAAFARDGNRVMTGCEDGKARIWDASTGRPLTEWLPHDARLQAVGFSPNGKRVVTASRDWKARVWDPATGTVVGEPMRHSDPVMAATFSADGRFILTGCLDGTARLWNAATTAPVGVPMTHQGSVRDVAFSPDGHFVLTAGSGPVAQMWEIDDGEPEPTRFTYDGWPDCMTLSGDGRLLAIGGGGRIARIYDVARGRPISAPLTHGDYVQALAFNRAGTMIASGGDDQTVRFWEAATGRVIGEPLQHRDKVESLIFSPDDQRVLSGTRGGTISLWDVRTRRLVGERPAQSGPVSALAFSPDGSKFLTGGADQIGRLWSVASLRPIGAALRHQGRLWTVAFDPSGRIAATAGADKTLRLWDGETGAPLTSPIVDRVSIRRIAFAPDGRSVFLGGSGETSRQWDLMSRAPIGPPLKHRGTVLAAAFERSGDRILAGCEDLTIRSLGVPVPLEGDVQSITLSIQVMTNMEIDRDGAIQTLSARDWRERSERLRTRPQGRPMAGWRP